MGLLGNGFRHNLTGRITTATTNLDGCNASTIPASRNLTAMRRNMLTGEAITNRLASVPSGKRPPNVWLMANEGGSISSFRRSNIQVSGAATAELGYPATGSTSFTIDATATGGMIVGATGTATITIDGTAAIVATLNSTGTATISIDGHAALGAIASLTGTGTITIDGHAELMGLGYMTGTTVESGLTPAGIANAVWNSLLSQYTGDGTAGKALGLASSGGVDYDALWASMPASLKESLAEYVRQAALADPFEVNIKQVNDTPLTGNGQPSTPWGPA